MTGETVADFRYLGVPPSIARSIEADGAEYSAVVWIGHDASPRLRAALGRVVASLSFPRLEPGTILGDLTVLQSADRYPIGSFTQIRTQGLLCDRDPRRCHWGSEAPFYLVHAHGRLQERPLVVPCVRPRSCTPLGGFYAIGWRDEGTIGGYRSGCDLRVDRSRMQFYCTNLHARWDRVGRVIARPPGSRFGDPLQFTPAKVSWDHHVLFAPGTDEHPPPLRSLRLLWPRWRP
jgi:hypothetical protein